MGTVKTLSKDRLRLYCDCGRWVHELSNEDGKIHCESLQVAGKEKEKNEEKEKKPRNALAGILGNDDDE